MSDGTPWRPLANCRDIARVFAAFVNTPQELTHNKAINVGRNLENYQVKDIVSVIQKLIPKANIVFTGEAGKDPRNYRVKFDLLGMILPEFEFEYNLDKGMKELYQKFIERKFNLSDFEGAKFVRLRTLKNRLHLIKI
jgi:nucleoside-diphosphate-sugar epimerase